MLVRTFRKNFLYTSPSRSPGSLGSLVTIWPCSLPHHHTHRGRIEIMKCVLCLHHDPNYLDKYHNSNKWMVSYIVTSYMHHPHQMPKKHSCQISESSYATIKDALADWFFLTSFRSKTTISPENYFQCFNT